MATCNSTPVSGTSGKLPFFELCDGSGKYTTRRELTSDQIIRAAKAALANRCTRGTVLTSPEAVADYLIIHYSAKPAEVFTCVFLDNRHRLIAVEDLFFGTIDGASVHPREIARRCLELNAAAVILAHYVARHIMGVMCPVFLCAPSGPKWRRGRSSERCVGT
jgi:DNA repair protein RadC